LAHAHNGRFLITISFIAMVTNTLNVPLAASTTGQTTTSTWQPWQRVLFRIAFPFFVLLSLPSDVGWYKNLVTIDWLHGHYRDVYDIARFSPTFFLGGGAEGGAPTLLGYDKWFIALGIALVIGLVWTLLDRKREEYEVLYFGQALALLGLGSPSCFQPRCPILPSGCSTATWAT
jgi:hypothetical protein